MFSDEIDDCELVLRTRERRRRKGGDVRFAFVTGVGRLERVDDFLRGGPCFVLHPDRFLRPEGVLFLFDDGVAASGDVLCFGGSTVTVICDELLFDVGGGRYLLEGITSGTRPVGRRLFLLGCPLRSELLQFVDGDTRARLSHAVFGKQR